MAQGLRSGSAGGAGPACSPSGARHERVNELPCGADLLGGVFRVAGVAGHGHSLDDLTTEPLPTVQSARWRTIQPNRRRSCPVVG